MKINFSIRIKIKKDLINQVKKQNIIILLMIHLQNLHRINSIKLLHIPKNNKILPINPIHLAIAIQTALI